MADADPASSARPETETTNSSGVDANADDDAAANPGAAEHQSPTPGLLTRALARTCQAAAVVLAVLALVWCVKVLVALVVLTL